MGLLEQAQLQRQKTEESEETLQEVEDVPEEIAGDGLLAKAIRSRNTTDWSIMIITDEKYRDIISEKASSLIFN